MFYIITLVFSLAIAAGSIIWYQNESLISSDVITPGGTARTTSTETPTIASVQIETPPDSYTLPQSRFVSQSFNNCGPASLSMVMSMFGTYIDQETLADRMRPFRNPQGGIDDKSIFAAEFVTYAKEYGFNALERPNGDIELLKKLVANDIPVVVRTWLNLDEDIGHFRIVRGYNETNKTLLQDDSYQGPNLTYSYDDFLAMWQPFNYGYILVYPPEKQEVVEAILGEDLDAATAYRKSIQRAEKELTENPQAFYPHFNIATANYYLGEYQQAIDHYEKALPNLPARMLWYQLEPIQAYQKLGEDDVVFRLTDRILTNGNRAYSELYQMRGEIYRKQGNTDAAREEFEKAVYYNKNFQPAKDALIHL